MHSPIDFKLEKNSFILQDVPLALAGFEQAWRYYEENHHSFI
jgi:hypothetical protein